MNPLLAKLQPYPFERLKQLFASVIPNPALRHISLGIGEPKDHQRWLEQMITIFPNVKEGDRIRGVYSPGKSAVFLLNDQSIGRIDDALFARGFFAIWLDPKTSEPKLRQSLLGPLLSRR